MDHVNFTPPIEKDKNLVPEESSNQVESSATNFSSSSPPPARKVSVRFKHDSSLVQECPVSPLPTTKRTFSLRSAPFPPPPGGTSPYVAKRRASITEYISFTERILFVVAIIFVFALLLSLLIVGRMFLLNMF